jgi:integrase
VLLAGGHDDWTKRPGTRAQVTKDQVDAVRALASERIRVAIDLAVSTRQRRGDLLTVRREHLTDEGIVFRQSKTGAGCSSNGARSYEPSWRGPSVFLPQVPGDYLIRKRNGFYGQLTYTGPGRIRHLRRPHPVPPTIENRTVVQRRPPLDRPSRPPEAPQARTAHHACAVAELQVANPRVPHPYGGADASEGRSAAWAIWPA